MINCQFSIQLFWIWWFMNSFFNAKSNKLNVRKKALYELYRIFLRYLQPEDCFENLRQLNQKNVTRLIKIFELKHCLKFDFTHYVSALISREHFAFIIQKAAIDSSTLTFHEDLIYLHDKHRIEIVRKIFHFNDWWWIIDLYCENQFLYHAFFEVLLIIIKKY